MPTILETRIPCAHPVLAGSDLTNPRLYDSTEKWRRDGFVLLRVVTPRSRPLLTSFTPIDGRPVPEVFIERRYSSYTPTLRFLHRLGSVYDRFPYTFVGKWATTVIVADVSEIDDEEGTEISHAPEIICPSNMLVELLGGGRIEVPHPHQDLEVLADWLQDRDQYQRQAEYLRTLLSISKLPWANPALPAGNPRRSAV